MEFRFASTGAAAEAVEGKPAGTLVIHEIYRSLQGESTFAGLPCVFVRLTACHLRCVYCDTPHAFNQGETMTAGRGRRAGTRAGRQPRRDHRRRALAATRGLSPDEPPGRCRQDGPARDQRRDRHQRRRPPRPHHPRPQDPRLGRGRGQRLEQPRRGSGPPTRSSSSSATVPISTGRSSWSASIA